MWYRSIGFKLIFSVGIAVMLVFMVFSYVNLEAQRKQLLQEMVRNSNLVSEVIKRSLRYNMLQYNPDQLYQAIDTIGAQEGIEKVRIFNARGEIIYSSDKKEVGTVLDKTAEQCYACHSKEKPFKRLSTTDRSRIFSTTKGYQLLGMINPIYNEPDCFNASCHVHPKDQEVLGVLDIDVSLREINDLIKDQRNKMVLFTLLAVSGIFIIIAVLINRLLRQPVKQLLEGTERVAAGDLMTPIPVTSKDELGILANSFNQMTARLRDSERELKASEEKYRSLFENDPNPIFVVDLETFQIMDVNIRAIETYGYSREEFLSMSFLDLGDEEEAEKIQSLVVHSCIFLPKIRHRKKDGTVLYVNIHSCPRQHLGKDVIIANIADISDRIQAEAQLIQAGKMATLGEMSAGVAHELNQPLNAIRVGTEYLHKIFTRNMKVSEEVVKKVCNEVISQVERASSIINHLREFGRKSEVDELDKIDINKPIRDVFTLLGQQLRVREIEVKLELDDNLPPILGVPNRLEQVFLNLVMNARDAILEKKEIMVNGDFHPCITIRSYCEGDKIVVDVIDNGIGIPEEVKDRIFEPFFTTKEVGKGTGLGLSISYGIVKDYGGSIQIESTGKEGTTFRITFPVADK
ncbi:MAG: PAS domain-containing sensor histidine kinase [Deltaproteobacteria bacterium]|nr:MAG: PAS domain-containing sensor histidine kinase [Deltaproteobacteria bacterium]